MIFDSRFTIRTFHTDAFGHVNNARYMELLEESRWQFAEHIGLVNLLRESHLGFIIMAMRLQFRAPVIESDTIVVSTSLISLGSASGEVRQTVRKEGQGSAATRCLSHFILIDRLDGRSMPIQGRIRELLVGIVEHEKSVTEV